MNSVISQTGAAIVAVTVFLFAVCLGVGFLFGSYVVCMLLPLGYIMMAAGFHQESREDARVPATVGMVFAGIYAALILTVYFAQTTTVRLESLEGRALRILDYRRGGLFFNLDLLGYGMMALSTFFLGLAIRAKDRADRWLKALMLGHGVFFVGCFVLPMTGIFTGMADGDAGSGGTIALLFWCAWFFPVGALAFRHFQRGGR